MDASDRLCGALAGYLVSGAWSLSCQSGWSEKLSASSVKLFGIGKVQAPVGYLSSRVEMGWIILTTIAGCRNVSEEVLWDRIFSWGRQTRTFGEQQFRPNLRSTEKQLLLDCQDLRAQEAIREEIAEASSTTVRAPLTDNGSMLRALAFSFRFESEQLEEQIIKTHPFSIECECSYLLGTLLQHLLEGRSFEATLKNMSNWIQESQVQQNFNSLEDSSCQERYPNALETFKIIMKVMKKQLNWVESLELAFAETPQSALETVLTVVGTLIGAQLGIKKMLQDPRFKTNFRIVLELNRDEGLPSHLPEPSLCFIDVCQGLGSSFNPLESMEIPKQNNDQELSNESEQDQELSNESEQDQELSIESEQDQELSRVPEQKQGVDLMSDSEEVEELAEDSGESEEFESVSEEVESVKESSPSAAAPSLEAFKSLVGVIQSLTTTVDKLSTRVEELSQVQLKSPSRVGLVQHQTTTGTYLTVQGASEKKFVLVPVSPEDEDMQPEEFLYANLGEQCVII